LFQNEKDSARAPKIFIRTASYPLLKSKSGTDEIRRERGFVTDIGG